VLEGVSRRTAIELCQALGLPLVVAPIPVDTMRQADEVYLTSSGGGILPIARLDGVALPHSPGGAKSFPGPVSQRLYDAYWALHDDPRYRDDVDYD
jgi:branched-chain amino acid aminotransferase